MRKYHLAFTVRLYALFTLGALLLAPGLVTDRAFAGQESLGHWVITIRKAANLVDKDWGRQKLSDPYVEITANDREQTVKWKTRVVSDSLNPSWEQSFVWHDTTAWQRGPLLRMTIWDADPNLGVTARAFLGNARLAIAVSGPGDFTLRLERRIPGLCMPGMLFISVRHVVQKRVAVPDLRGKAYAQARAILQGLGLRCRQEVTFTLSPTPDAGKIYTQNPSAGSRVKPGTRVLLLVHTPITKPMPRLVGLSVPKARARLTFLQAQPRVVNAPARLSAKPASWYRVVRQSVPMGTGIALTTQVTLVQSVPGPNARVTVPDLVGLELRQAEQRLRAVFLRVQWAKQESPLEQNGKVLTQEPASGKQVAPGSVVKAGFGHFSDGLCYSSAREVQPGKVESFRFNKPGMRQFRMVRVKQTGYLVLRRKSTPFVLKSDFYRSGNMHELAPCGRPFDQAQRVTPGQWIFSVYPEFSHDTSPTPAMIKVELVPEMDFAEPNNSPELATPITLDARLNPVFAGVADSDYYRFSLETPGYVGMNLDHDAIKGYEHAATPLLWLYDSNHKELAFRSVDRVCWLGAGTYYVKFACEGARENFDLRKYPVNISWLGNPDRMEPNNTPDQATRINLPAAFNVCYHTNDRDYYILQSKVPGYAIFSHSRDPGFAVVLRRYDRDGRKIGRRAFLPCAVRVDGDTLVSLAPEMRESYCVRRPLPLGIRFIPASADPYEPNDKLQQAHPLLVGETVRALCLPADDLDTYRFRLEQKAMVSLEVPGKPEDIVLQAHIFDNHNQPLKKDLYLPVKLKLDAGEYWVQLFQEGEVMHTRAYMFRVDIINPSGQAHGQGVVTPRYQSRDKTDRKVQDGIDLAREAYQRYLAHKYQEAIDLYLRAVKLAPSIAAIWNDLGASYFHVGNPDAARRGFDRAVKLRPGYALAWRNLAVLTGKQGDFKQALPFCEKAATLDPSADNLRYAGYTYYFAGVKMPDQRRDHWSRAADFLERSLDLKPDQLARKRLAQVRAYLAR